MEFKKYIIMSYDGLAEDLEFYFIETDIEKWTDEFVEMLESFETNHSNNIILNYDEFLNSIKDIDFKNVNFQKITLEEVKK
ncbi:MAG: hypothetical protein AABY22_13115 [Nanoarchaeota archaeon]